MALGNRELHATNDDDECPAEFYLSYHKVLVILLYFNRHDTNVQ